MDTLKQKFNDVRQKPMLVFSMGCLFLFVFSVFFVYYLRVVYSPEWMGQIKWTGIVFTISVALFAIYFFAGRLTGKDSGLFMSILLFAIGCVYTFATPPNQVPDEHTHYLRGYQMACGEWGFDEGYVFPDDVNLLVDTFHVAHNNGYPAKVGNTMYNRFTEYRQGLENGTKAENMGIIIFQFIPYIPLTTGIFIAKCLGFGALGAYYRGRLGNVVFFCLCAYFAMKLADRFKIILFMLMAMPLSVFVYASCNSDAVLFGLMYLMFACVLSEKFDNTKFVIFAVTIAVLTTCKQTYIVFLLLLFAINKEKWAVNFRDRKMNRVISLIISVFCLAFVYVGMGLYVKAFSNYGVIERTMEGTNAMGQLKFILSNPLRYIAIFLDTLKNNSFFIFSGGLLGWLDVNIPLINYTTPIVAILCCINQATVFKKEDAKIVCAFLVCSVLTYGVVMTGLYLSWTPVTLPQIIGLQMRYFYPAFMGFCLGIGYYFMGRTKCDAQSRDASCIATSYLYSIIGAVMMLVIYYLPRRAVVFVA